MIKHYKVKPILVSSGAISASRTLFMTGQIDVGWTIPPFNLDLVQSGQARIVFRATDLPEMQQQTTRVNVAHPDLLKTNRRAVEKFNRGYQKALDWMYDKQDESTAAYAKFANVPLAIAKQVPSFYPRALLEKVGLVGLDRNMKDAIDAKFIKKPLTDAQVKKMVQVVEPK
jgi:NitT/TauT family transport system substrate-binding protein